MDELVESMTNGTKGIFSLSLESLRLHMENMLEGVGGDKAIGLLDQLSHLGSKEQEVVLKIFHVTLSRVLKGTLRLETEDDRLMKELEDSLVDSIVKELESNIAPRLEVVSGGKDSSIKESTTLIDFSKAKARKANPKPFVN